MWFDATLTLIKWSFSQRVKSVHECRYIVVGNASATRNHDQEAKQNVTLILFGKMTLKQVIVCREE